MSSPSVTAKASRGTQKLSSVVALAALLLPLLAGVVGHDLAGWRPDHGHLARHGAVPEHAHPYDHDDEHAPGSSPEGTEDEADLVFTFSGHAHGAAVIAVAHSASPLVPSADVLPSVAIELIGDTRRNDASVAVPTPPPRT